MSLSLSARSHLQPYRFQRLIGFLIVPKDRQRSLSTWHPLCVSPAIDPTPPPLCPASPFSKPLPPVGCASNYRISHTTGPLRPLSKPPDNSGGWGLRASTQQPLDFTDSHPAYLGNSSLLSSHRCYYMSPVTQNQYADTETTLSIPHRHKRPANQIQNLMCSAIIYS